MGNEWPTQRFVSSKGSMTVLISHTHSIVCALAYIEQFFFLRDTIQKLVRAHQYLEKIFFGLWKHEISPIFFSAAKDGMVCPDSWTPIKLFQCFIYVLDTNLWTHYDYELTDHPKWLSAHCDSKENAKRLLKALEHLLSNPRKLVDK